MTRAKNCKKYTTHFQLMFVMITIISLGVPNIAEAEVSKPKVEGKFTEFKVQVKQAQEAANELKTAINKTHTQYGTIIDGLKKSKKRWRSGARNSPNMAEEIKNSYLIRIKNSYKDTQSKYKVWAKERLEARKAAEALMKELKK